MQGLLNIKQGAERLGFSSKHLSHLIKTNPKIGKLYGEFIGKRRYCKESELNRYLGVRW